MYKPQRASQRDTCVKEYRSTNHIEYCMRTRLSFWSISGHCLSRQDYCKRSIGIMKSYFQYFEILHFFTRTSSDISLTLDWIKLGLPLSSMPGVYVIRMVYKRLPFFFFFGSWNAEKIRNVLEISEDSISLLKIENIRIFTGPDRRRRQVYDEKTRWKLLLGSIWLIEHDENRGKEKKTAISDPIFARFGTYPYLDNVINDGSALSQSLANQD